MRTKCPECKAVFCAEKFAIDNDEDVDNEVQGILEWARMNGHEIKMSGRIRTRAAALYCDLAHRTIQNLVSDGAIPSARFRGKGYVFVEDLAKFIVNENKRLSH